VVFQRRLPQTLTYWGPSGRSDRFSKPIFDAPILINGRWQAKIQQVRTTSGQEITVNSEVYVDRDLAIDGYLGVGDLTTNADPTGAEVPASPIKSWNTMPNLRNLDQERIAYL